MVVEILDAAGFVRVAGVVCECCLLLRNPRDVVTADHGQGEGLPICCVCVLELTEVCEGRSGYEYMPEGFDDALHALDVGAAE